MSYDVAFWRETPRCKYDAATIYRRLRRGLPVEGLKPIARGNARKIVKSLLNECDETADDRFAGHIDDAHVEIYIGDDAILADFSLGASHLAEVLSEAFRPLGLVAFDPQGAPAAPSENLYDYDYAEVSGDPDIDYWVPVELSQPAPQHVDDASSMGGQTISDIQYSFFQVDPATEEAPIAGVFPFYQQIMAGRASVPSDRFNCGNLDGFGSIAVLIVVPADVIARCANGNDPRIHVRMFTAFGNDEKVIHYHSWNPHSPGICATVITLKEMPTRMKTLISTRFLHRG